MLRGLPDLAKENYRKSLLIEDYQTFNIPYLFLTKGDNFHFFYKGVLAIRRIFSLVDMIAKPKF